MNGLGQRAVLVGDWAVESKKYSEGRGRTTVRPTEDGKISQDGRESAGQWEMSEVARTGKSTSTSRTRKSATDVDGYMAAAPSAAQPLLRQLRAAIKEAAPKAEERISYGIVGYFYEGRLIYLGGHAKHVALYPSGDAKGLEKYLYGAATLRFPLSERLPVAKIKALVRARVKERDAELATQTRARARRPASGR